MLRTFELKLLIPVQQTRGVFDTVQAQPEKHAQECVKCLAVNRKGLDQKPCPLESGDCNHETIRKIKLTDDAFDLRQDRVKKLLLECEEYKCNLCKDIEPDKKSMKRHLKKHNLRVKVAEVPKHAPVSCDSAKYTQRLFTLTATQTDNASGPSSITPSSSASTSSSSASSSSTPRSSSGKAKGKVCGPQLVRN